MIYLYIVYIFIFVFSFVLVSFYYLQKNIRISYIYVMSVDNLCLKKRVQKPNKCKKVRGCKVATGTKRTYCRKAHNKSKKNVTHKKRKTLKNKH